MSDEDENEVTQEENKLPVPVKRECPTEFEEVFEEFDFKVKTKEGMWREACLREMSGEKRDNFLNKNKNKMERDGQSVKDFKNIQAILLNEVWWWKDTERFAELTEIQAKPAKMLDDLYNKAIEMNRLGKDAQAQAKNG